MEDPLADPLGLPSDTFEYDDLANDDQRSETSRSESSSEQQNLKDEEEPLEEIIAMREENFPFECDVCGKKFKSKPGKDF